MSRSDLDVSGWVSGLYLVVAGALVLIGLVGATLSLPPIIKGNATAWSWVNLIVAGGIPVGSVWFWRTLLRVRAEIRAENAPPR